jgi:hypothetical protein
MGWKCATRGLIKELRNRLAIRNVKREITASLEAAAAAPSANGLSSRQVCPPCARYPSSASTTDTIDSVRPVFSVSPRRLP